MLGTTSTLRAGGAVFTLRLSAETVDKLDALRSRYGDAPRSSLVRWAIDRFVADVHDAEHDRASETAASGRP